MNILRNCQPTSESTLLVKHRTTEQQNNGETATATASASAVLYGQLKAASFEKDKRG
ncbi:hypothetical protein CANARDRAFT_26869, partial [[Candida] arabinofermentans NRRL YB-2248]